MNLSTLFHLLVRQVWFWALLLIIIALLSLKVSWDWVKISVGWESKIGARLTFVYLGTVESENDTHNQKKNSHSRTLSDNLHPFLDFRHQWDRELATRLAESWGKQAEFIPMSNINTLKDFLYAHPASIAIGVPVESLSFFTSFPAYRESTLVLVAPKNTQFPTLLTKSPANSSSKKTSPSLIVAETEPQRLRLAIQSTNPHVPKVSALLADYRDVQLDAVSARYVTDIIDTVSKNQADYAFIEKSDWSLLSHIKPHWEAKLSLVDNLKIGWIASKKLTQKDQRVILDFFAQAQADRVLLSLAEQYRLDYNRLDSQDLNYLEKRKEKRLPKLLPHFQEAAEITQQSPYLLMALSYQESHWDETQVSHSGARGLMMINAITAEFLGLPSNPDARTQIIAGARYLKMLRDDLVAIPEPDRTLIALAGYNIGPGALSRVLRRFVKQQSLYNEKQLQPNQSKPSHLQPLLGKTEPQVIPTIKPAARIISANFSAQQWRQITWPRIRYYIIQEALQRRMSSQPVILTERVRIFKAWLEAKAIAKSPSL